MTAIKSDIRKIMKSIPLTSTDGCAPGFFNILPLGRWTEKCIDFLTDRVRNTFNVQAVTFPLFFPSDKEEIKELVKKFDARGEVFHLRDDDLALSYSPDPNLLLWLSNKIIKRKQLPYAVETLSIFLRRTKSGGLNGIDRVRQFSFPGVFILTAKNEAEKNVLLFLKLASQIMRMIFGENWKIKITVYQGFYEKNRSHFLAIEKVVGKKIDMTLQPQQTRYFAYKLGLYADAGYSDLMIFNLQWDDKNSDLFNIKMDSGEELIIIHTTLAGALNRVYPAIIANQQTNGIKVFPPLVAPYQVGIICDENSNNSGIIQEIIQLLDEKHIRYYVSQESGFNKKIASADKLWIPYLIIFPKEAKILSDIKVFSRTKNGKEKIILKDLIEETGNLLTTNSILAHQQIIKELPF